METLSDLSTDPGFDCPACGSRAWKPSGQVKDYSVSGEWFELLECTGCHLKATYPQPSPSQIGRYYASSQYVSHTDTRAGLTNKLFHKARTFMLDKKRQWVSGSVGKSSGRILDVGAGTGYFARAMKDNGWDVVALEPDETARSVASEKLGMVLLPIDAISSLQPGSFDVITLWHVIEHVHNIRDYMTRFHHLLKSDGVLLIAVPNYTSRDASQYGSKWAAFDVPRHLWHFTPASMNKMLTTYGFRLVKKISMPLDAFYVSMLSEKYRGNYFFGPLLALISGTKSFLSGRQKIDFSSSLIFVSKKR